MKRKWSTLATACCAAIAAPEPVAAQHLSDLAKAQAADPASSFVRASDWVSTKDGPAFVELLISGDEAALRERTSSNANPQLDMIASPNDVLRLLADKRMQFLAKPLSAWMGGSVEIMRDRALARLRAAVAAGDPAQPSSTTSESTVRPKVRATIQLAQFLIAIGRNAEAEQALASELARSKLKGGSSRTDIEWYSLAAWIATSRWDAGNDAGAIQQYEYIEKAMGRSPYAANARVSRASLLAKSGRYDEALRLIDSTWADWMRDNRGDKVAGSYRQFAWIRACALDGLGRRAEAQSVFQVNLQSHDTKDPHYVIASDEALRMNGLTCMKDADAIVAVLRDGLRNELHPRGLLVLQPNYRPKRDSDLWRKIRLDPDLAKDAADRMIVLPENMSAALNGWPQN